LKRSPAITASRTKAPDRIPEERKQPYGKPSGDIAKNHYQHAGPGRPAYEYDVRPRHQCEPENG